MSYDRYWIKVAHIHDVVEQLSEKGQDGSFAVLMFIPPKLSRNNNNDVNLQYSIEFGITGLDWVLLGPRNLKDKNRISIFLKKHGFKVLNFDMNDVRYFRIEEKDISLAGIQIATKFYGLTLDEDIELLIHGFTWDEEFRMRA